jgi:hypothetical protein
MLFRAAVRWRGVAAAASASVAGATVAWHAGVAADSKSAPNAETKAPGLELLVHNISHADMVIRLEEERLDGSKGGPDEAPNTFLARPQFNSYMPVSIAINEELEKQAGSIISCMSKYRVNYPAGLDLTRNGKTKGALLTPSDGASQPSTWKILHIKGSKNGGLTGKDLAEQGTSVPRVVAAYFPLISMVIPEWIRTIKRRSLLQPVGSPPPRKVLVLVSGAGQPRDEQANPGDNSTEGTGQLIERFVKLVHPDIEVVHIPSAFGIFRYDDNVRFVKEQVLPVIEAKRSDVVATHGENWSERLKLTVCLADGAPARISALHAATRAYRPDYLHVWRTKTFWDTGTLCEEDVESHTFKKIEMRPATHRSQLAERDQLGLVDEMVRYKRQFEAVRDSNEHELGSFWLRKTGKAVLAVLLTVRRLVPCHDALRSPARTHAYAVV